MEPETINSTELRAYTRDYMERVKFNRECFVVMTFGRPMAVIISLEDFQLAQTTLNRSIETVIKPMVAHDDTRVKKGRHKKTNLSKHR